MDDNFSVPKIYKDSEDKALSKICLERHFEWSRACKRVC
jgi:hypothetical protein